MWPYRLQPSGVRHIDRELGAQALVDVPKQVFGVEVFAEIRMCAQGDDAEIVLIDPPPPEIAMTGR